MNWNHDVIVKKLSYKKISPLSSKLMSISHSFGELISWFMAHIFFIFWELGTCGGVTVSGSEFSYWSGKLLGVWFPDFMKSEGFLGSK